MKSILLASDFLIVGYVLQNLCETVTRSGKQLKFVENKTVEDYLETTHLKLFQKFTGSQSKKPSLQIRPGKTYRGGLKMMIFTVIIVEKE